MPNYGVNANPDIRPLGPVTEKDVENIRECFAQDMTVNDTARKLGLSTKQVSHHKKKHGLTTQVGHDNSAGTQAFAERSRNRRMARYDDYSEINELSRGLLLKVLRGEQKHMTILRGAMGVERQEEVDQIPARDQREWVNALTQLEVALVKIEDKEDDSGLTRAQSMLDMVMQAVTGTKIEVPENEGSIEE